MIIIKILPHIRTIRYTQNDGLFAKKWQIWRSKSPPSVSGHLYFSVSIVTASFFTHSFPLIDKYNRREYADEQCADNFSPKDNPVQLFKKDFAVPGNKNQLNTQCQG